LVNRFFERRFYPIPPCGTKTKKKVTSKVRKGARYECSVCGIVVTVDEVCGCVDVCDIICCGKQMRPKKKG
jgi:hypothetical protein